MATVVTRQAVHQSARQRTALAGRNQIGLTERQITYCVEAWVVLYADRPIAFDTSEAVQYVSRTRFDEAQNGRGKLRPMAGAT